MSKTRYGHSSVGGGNQDKAERKDEGWTSRQGGDESSRPGRRGDPTPSQRAPGEERPTPPPQGTNTQGELAGIGEASEEVAQRLGMDDVVPQARESGPTPDAPPTSAQDAGGTSVRDRDLRGAGTDQPPRMGGPLGPDPERPHLPEGAQDNETQGTGKGGFDRGVNAQNVGAVHQGARPDEAR